MSNIRVILFDMDGVLVDASEWHREALNRALLEHGYEPIPLMDHVTRFDGLPSRKKLGLLGIDDPATIEAINATKQHHTQAIIRECCFENAAHHTTLSKLCAEGYRLAVCSNSVRETIRLVLERSGLTPYFAFFLSYEDVVAPKPDPSIYLAAMERFQCNSEQTLILEDNPNGLRAAHASGASVMEISSIHEVSYERIRACITDIESSRE